MFHWNERQPLAVACNGAVCFVACQQNLEHLRHCGFPCGRRVLCTRRVRRGETPQDLSLCGFDGFPKSLPFFRLDSREKQVSSTTIDELETRPFFIDLLPCKTRPIRPENFQDVT